MRKIESERLILRNWKLSDEGDLFEYSSDDKVMGAAGMAVHESLEKSRTLLKEMIEKSDSYAIVLKEEDKVIGGISFHEKKPDESLKHLDQKGLGFLLNSKYWGRGIVPEAVEAIVAYGFENMGLDLIWCAHFDTNMKSKRVIEKTGFTFRIQKDIIFESLGNKEVTALYYALTKEEYLSK